MALKQCYSAYLVFFADFEQSVTNNTSLKYVPACILMVKSSNKQVKNYFQI